MRKVFQIRKPGGGLWRWLFPEYEEKCAVDDICLTVEKGERVAFIGPNGAGKSTLIKMLLGIFRPTQGHIRVLGLDPQTEAKKIARRSSSVFGQRSQLWYHLPPQRSFELFREIYEVPEQVYWKNLRELIDIFELSSFLLQPVKQLSLGQRIRCELTANLLHQPEILFLDEPTIGLDLLSRAAIGDLLVSRSCAAGMTIFLTSHDIGDIERICERVVIIDKGRIILDTSVRDLVQRFAYKRTLRIQTHEAASWRGKLAEILKEQSERQSIFLIDTRQHSIQEVMNAVFSQTTVRDLSVDTVSLEQVIRDIYTGLCSFEKDKYEVMNTERGI